MIELLDALASLFMIAGLFSSFLYFTGLLIEKAFLMKVNKTHGTKIEWIPREKFQYVLGYAAAISGFGFLIAYPIAERQKHIWSYALIAVSIWFMLQANMRISRAQLSRQASSK